MSQIVSSTYPVLTAPAAADVLPIVDVDDDTMSPSGTTKQVTVSNLLGAQASGWKPSDYGVAAWTYDPALIAASYAPTAGSLWMIGIQVRTAVTVSKIYLATGNGAAAGVTAGENFVGLYSSSTLLASAAADANFASTYQLNTLSITSQNLTPGLYWVAFLMNATTMPALGNMWGSSGVTTAVNLGLSAATYRYATGGAGLTALPSSTPTLTAGNRAFWAAIG